MLLTMPYSFVSIFFFTARAASCFSTLSLHDALPIYLIDRVVLFAQGDDLGASGRLFGLGSRSRTGPRSQPKKSARSEEHTSELQSRGHLVCRPLLEKKNTASPNST